MRFQNILHSLSMTPWAILPEMHKKISDIVDAHVSGEAHMPDGILEKFSMEKDPIGDKQVAPPAPYSMLDGGIAVITISGVISKRVSPIVESSGVVDIDKISAAIRKAEMDKAVKGILFDFSTPGGSVTGLKELAAQIRSCRKPTLSYTDTLCCSAGYWLASACREVMCSSSSEVGSVGVYMEILDSTKAMEQKGLKKSVVKAGKVKADMVQGMPISDDAIKTLQGKVDTVYGWFVSDVLTSRSISTQYLQGGVYFGDEAVAIGFCDAIGSISDAVAELKAIIEIG